MEKRRGDRRVRYSHQVIRQSLLELLAAKPLNQITVKEICDRADINRGTFYAYYRDPYDLMQRIEDDLVEEIMRALNQPKGESAKNAASVTYSVVLELMEFIRQNAELCRILLSGKANSSFVSRVIQEARAVFAREWSDRTGQCGEETLDYLYTFSVTGSIGVVQRWMQSGMKETPAQIATIVEKTVYQGIGAFAAASD